MRVALFVIALLLGSAVPASATSGVTGKFDGVYAGTAEPAPDMGPRGCPPFAVDNISVAQGFLKSPKSADLPLVSGFITEEGYVAAFMARPGHVRSAMDGRLEDGVIAAGFIEGDTGCAWIIHLTTWP